MLWRNLGDQELTYDKVLQKVRLANYESSL